MKRLVFLVFCLIIPLGVFSQSLWRPAGNKIMTPWAAGINVEDVLPDYPRPQMQRDRWMTLNGLWEYAIVPKGGTEPAAADGRILVPFAMESALSGAGRTVGEENEVWYRRSFNIPADWKNKNVLLHFGAVDWLACVFVNDVLIGTHKGGYTPFFFDITPFLTGKGPQKLVVRVWDPADKGFQPRGKQVSQPGGIWYTSVTGIWQTVWMEPVDPVHVTSVVSVADVDNGVLCVTVRANDAPSGAVAQVQVLDKGKVLASAKGVVEAQMRIKVDDPRLWTPESPSLYDLNVTLSDRGRVCDQVISYTAFRKISVARDANGIARMQLNNKPVFQLGPLDQGWWPDGLYTAPSDEALQYDIVKTKELGFNMIRKHVKVEPARWYYHCDRLGILVWQDMPSGDLGNSWRPYEYGGGTDKNRSAESMENYYREWKEIIDLLISHPCVVVWVPFNEAWGQFNTAEVVDFTAACDPSRLINAASGGNHRPCGHILDIHNYPNPDMFLYDPQRVNVLGEYGGIGLALEEHLWEPERNWGYVQYKSAEEVTAEYIKYTQELIPLIKQGFSAAVYTQTTDCEIEVNGLMTYDRKVLKVDARAVRRANEEVRSTVGSLYP
jgi:beta-galactosidase/beta-glucuronidase